MHLLRRIDLSGAFDRCCGVGTIVLQKGLEAMMLVDFPLEDGDSMIAGVGDQQADRDTVAPRRLCSAGSSPRLER